MSFSSIKLTLLISVILTICHSAKILYLMPFTAKSHYIYMKALALELANRGHEVYAVTAYKEDNYPPTYHQLKVETKTLWTTLFTERPNVFSISDYSFAEFQMLLYKSGFMVNELVFNSNDVQTFLNTDHHIELVISELFFNDALYMFAHKYQAPLVLVTTFGNSFKTNYFSRNPLQLSTLFHEKGRSHDPSSLLGRLKNMYYCIYDWFMTKYWYLPLQQEYARTNIKNLSEPVPRLEDLASNAALVLMNSHFSIDTSAAYLPNFIEVAGLHLENKPEPLPRDLQLILDSAKNGVIIMSLGSNVYTSELRKDKLNAFLTVFGELEQIIFIKWEHNTRPNMTDNIIMRKWLPQRAVLAHPNTKLFIGHGGLLGLQEAIAANVPIIGIPVFGDQYLNILQTVNNGYGELLEHKDITVESLRNTINKVLSDKSYTNKAREVAVRFKDRPMSGLDTAVWWIEYVLRNKGATFMKSPNLQMNFFAYHMFDIYLLLLTVFLIILFVLKKLFWVVGCQFRSQKRKKYKSE